MYRLKCIIPVLTFALLFCLLLSFMLLPGKTRGEIIAESALEHLEKRYVFNTAGPDTFDCSGLLVYCFEGYTETINHCAEEIGQNPAYLTIYSPDWLLPGDIICFDTVKDKDPSDHVGIWLGNNCFVHASSSNKKVMISKLEDFYLEHYTWGKRILFPYV